ncbi:MAG: hypothetical protein GPOALKHO_001517 [Sodalis sp.]|nr:MAG: hypothetical protein GPOALKHO_001517 [Sodalis sp.]
MPWTSSARACQWVAIVRVISAPLFITKCTSTRLKSAFKVRLEVPGSGTVKNRLARHSLLLEMFGPVFAMGGHIPFGKKISIARSALSPMNFALLETH